MTKRIIVLSVFFYYACGLSCLPQAQACECAEKASLAQPHDKAPLVVRGRVRLHDYHGIDIEVLDILKGEEERSIVRVWGDPGGTCRAKTKNFAIDSEWIFALSRESRYAGEDQVVRRLEAAEDYQLSSCGTHYEKTS